MGRSGDEREGAKVMGTVNVVILMGNLTRDPELRRTQGGQTVSDLGLAVNERYKNQAGEEVKKTCFVDVTVWGKQAESCAKFLRKGSPALVEGKLQYDQWESPEGGKRSKLRVVAERVRFLSGATAGDGRDDGGGADDEPAAAPAPNPRPPPPAQGRRPMPRDARAAC
jgi:single-strand DNA-binding protein